MSIDDLRSVDNDRPIKTDICIIGSGSAGWTIAEELAGSGLRLIMLESGGAAVHHRTQSLNEIEDIGRPLFNGRSRALGGTSAVWNGRCMPFDDVDYEERSWIPRSGWPFNASLMAPFVERASRHLNCGPYYNGNDRLELPDALWGRPAVNPDIMLPTCWENPPVINFGRILTSQRRANVWVLINATVTQLDTDDSGHSISSLEVADLDGRRLEIKARAFVLCAGGIENPRTLLFSNRKHANGVGNQHGVVGRYLIDHPRDFELIARVDLSDADKFRDAFGPFKLNTRHGRNEFNFGFKLSSRFQRENALVNAAAWPHEIYAADDPIGAAQRMLKGPRTNVLRDAGSLVRNAGLIAKGARRHIVHKQRVRRKIERIGFLVSSEQVPDAESRVQLAERTDWLGLPLSRVNWRVAELEARSQAALAESIASEFNRLGLLTIRLADWVREGRFSDANFTDGCHPSGATRMSTDPKDGVVDRDCRVHGVKNLFVGGSSVFPTDSHANPTLMIVALAVRLADLLSATYAPKVQARRKTLTEPRQAMATSPST